MNFLRGNRVFRGSAVSNLHATYSGERRKESMFQNV
jgi:hypothetical protein